MSDKNRVLTNRVFRKKMAALLGMSHAVEHFNDFEALDQTTFAKEMDKLIANPPWGEGGGSGGEDQFLIINFTGSESNDTITISCDTSCEDILASTKPIMAYFDTGESVMPLTRIDSLQFVYNMVLEQGIMQTVVSGDYAQGLPDSWEMNTGLIPFGGEPDGPIVYNAIVTTADAQAYTVSEFKDLEDNNVTLSAVLTALGITIDDGRYVRPVDLKDIVVNVSVNGTGAVAQYVNAVGKFHFTVADGISQTVNFSGAVIIAAPGESGFVSSPVLMNLRVSDNDGTPVYTFEQESIG